MPRCPVPSNKHFSAYRKLQEIEWRKHNAMFGTCFLLRVPLPSVFEQVVALIFNLKNEIDFLIRQYLIVKSNQYYMCLSRDLYIWMIFKVCKLTFKKEVWRKRVSLKQQLYAACFVCFCLSTKYTVGFIVYINNINMKLFRWLSFRYLWITMYL